MNIPTASPGGPVWRQAISGAQILFVAFGALVLVPLLTGLNPSMALLGAGVGTLLFQLVTRRQVPIFLGSSFAFIAPIIYATATWGLPATMGALACVSVMKTNRIGIDELTDKAGNSLHVKQLIGLKHWARPISKALNLEDGRLTFHVLEAPDPAAAIIDFATRNGADHIVMGARASSALRRYLGSVSAQVVAESPCTVTVVRETERAAPKDQ